MTQPDPTTRPDVPAANPARRGGGAPSVRALASTLGVSATSAHRLLSTGLVKTLADLRTLAQARPLPPLPDTLLVSLAPAHQLNESERERDGGFRTQVGVHAEQTPEQLRNAASAWWQARRTPRQLIALAPGGLVLDCWSVEDVLDLDSGGFHRFALGATDRRYTLALPGSGSAEGRAWIARTPRGPLSRWADGS